MPSTTSFVCSCVLSRAFLRARALLAGVVLLSATPSFAQPGPPEPANTVGVCPTGTTQVSITSVGALEDAARGIGAYASNPPNTCYLIANGTYQQNGSTLLMLISKGGAAPTGRHFVGATRQGVVIRGRATVEGGVSNVSIRNLTFNLTGYSQSGSFATLTVGAATNVTVSQVSFTGDCATGLKGGHIETEDVNGLVVDSSLIEKFGHCASGGHEDHGLYFASGSNITVSNSIIRNNSSRGIQLYTGGGDYGTLSNVTIRGNWIYANGHANYEDGIVINATGSGTITNALIERNLIYRNYYSGIRFVGDATSGVSIVQNTFDGNGSGSTSTARSEINLDDSDAGAGTALRRNIFNAGNRLINSCYDAAGRGFQFTDNVLNGSSAPSGSGGCVGTLVTANPQFVNAATGDYHTLNPAVAAYGAYGGSPSPVLSVPDVVVTEGNSGTTAATFVVTLTPASTQTVTVQYSTANGTATAGSDYAAASGSLSFPAGTTSRAVSVAVSGDTAPEPNEDFYLDLASPTNATIADGQSRATITNDDVATASLSIADASITEGNSGTQNMVFTVSLFPASAAPATVNYTTANVTALSGSDYTASAGSLSFPAGTTSRTIAVSIQGDVTVEPDETFRVTLSNAAGAVLARAQATGTIHDDDSAPPSTAVPVVWTAAAGVTVAGNSLTKTAAVAWGNAGAVSTKRIPSGEGYVEFMASETTRSRIVGLSKGNSGNTRDDVAFGIYINYEGKLSVYEKGSFRGNFGSYATGDLLRVAVVGGTVRYSRNGTVFYTSTVAPAYPLLVDAALYTQQATLSNVVVKGAQ